MRGLEQTGLVAIRPRKGALAVAKHLRLEQRFGEGRAVDGHEGPGSAAALLMYKACEQLLTSAGLACDEDGRVSPRNLSCERHRTTKGGRGPEKGDLLAVSHATEESGGQLVHVPRLQHDMRSAADEDLEVCRREWLGQIVPRASAERLDARCDAGMAGNDDDNCFALCRISAAKHVHTAHRTEV